MEEKPSKNFSALIVLAVVIVLVIVGFFVYRDRQAEERFSPKMPVSDEMMESTPEGEMASPSGEVKQFTVDGSNYSFVPNSITVNKGDTVKITFKDDDGLHNLSIEGYNVSTATLSAGGSSTVEFVADKVGTFEYFCNVDSHREKGMVGTLKVQ